MDTETRKGLEQLNETVNSVGWNILADDLETKIELLKEELTKTQIDGDLLKIAQGRILAYREILSLPAYLDQALKPEEDVGPEEDVYGNPV